MSRNFEFVVYLQTLSGDMRHLKSFSSFQDAHDFVTSKEAQTYKSLGACLVIECVTYEENKEESHAKLMERNLHFRKEKENMGLSISNKHRSIDVTASGFARLRQQVADCISPEMGEFYCQLSEGDFLIGEERKQFFEEYDKRLSTIDEELGVSHELLDFLYLPDTEASLSPKHCRRLWNVIKNYDDIRNYGYCARPTTFRDFKELVLECRNKGIRLRWS